MKAVGLIWRTETGPIEAIPIKPLATVPRIAGRHSAVEGEVAHLVRCRRPLIAGLGIEALLRGVSIRQFSAVAAAKRSTTFLASISGSAKRAGGTGDTD